jgi:7-cyano-7-deazaguanine synthase
MKIVVLLSGGLDSTVAAHKARSDGHEITAFTLRWGQPMWDLERASARRTIDALGCAWRVADLDLAPKSMSIGAGAIGPRVVAGRNLAFLAMAGALASAIGAEEVWIGSNADDARDYPDCRPEFIASANDLLSLVCGVRVHAPLLHLRKTEVVALGRSLNVPLEKTWSCYQSNSSTPCGTCNACALRTSAGA